MHIKTLVKLFIEAFLDENSADFSFCHFKTT